MATQPVDLMAEVPRAVEQHWHDRSGPVLLSALGLRLHPDARSELRLLKVNLSEYVEAHLTDRVRLLAIPGKGLAAAPVAETANLTDAELVRRFNAMMRQRSGSQSNPRFYPQVWGAFSRPLVKGTKRFLFIGPRGHPRHEDLPETASPPADGVEVREEHLPNGALGLGTPPGPVAEAIKNWAQSHQLDLSYLYVPEGREPDQSSASVNSDLLGILNLIEPNELARITVPGDVVVNLLRRALAKR